MKKNVLLFFVLFVTVSSCALLKGKKEIKNLRFEYSTNATINYGHSFEISTYAVYKNGKEKNISSKKELSIEVVGGKYKKSSIEINGYPKVLQADTVFVKATYTIKDKVYIYNEAIPFNYNGDLTIAFRGDNGAKGKDGKNRSTRILLRSGRTGEDGENGINGENGQDLTVNIWKEENSDRYRIRVINLVSQTMYEYTYRDGGFGIRFDVNGGTGGNGGDGGDGGDGKDGSTSEKKTKLPGDGGDGGDGGNGANGGNGGTVYIFLHPNAVELQNKIAVYNFGGNAGVYGSGGKEGESGKPLDGQDLAPDGVRGVDGVSGFKGEQGIPYVLIIEEFDIE